MTLDLALITYGSDGIDRVADMNLPHVDNVRYVLSWQQDKGQPLPESLKRNDLSVFRTDSVGAAVNRNNAIDHCTADVILFSDDDIIYTADQLLQVLEPFKNNPDLDLACFMATHPSGPTYPPSECQLTDPLPRGFWISAYQIAYRRERIADLRCHPEFGAGSKLLTGADDELFLLSAIRRGFHCRFIPINICTHPTLSTGTTTHLTPGNLRAVGCYITLAYPHSFIPRLLLKAWRVYRANQSGLFRAMRHIVSGAKEAPRILKGDRRYLW